MYHYIYALPLRQVWALMLVTVPMWAFGQLRGGRGLRSWKNANWILLALSLIAILSFTVFDRSSGNGSLNLIPFSTFFQARRRRELYRQMLMNVLLFFPLGLSLSTVLPERLSIGRRFALTVLAGFALSLAVELTQLVFRLGLVETDDLLTNSFGAALGALQLPLSRALGRLKR